MLTEFTARINLLKTFHFKCKINLNQSSSNSTYANALYCFITIFRIECFAILSKETEDLLSCAILFAEFVI